MYILLITFSDIDEMARAALTLKGMRRNFAGGNHNLDNRLQITNLPSRDSAERLYDFLRERAELETPVYEIRSF